MLRVDEVRQMLKVMQDRAKALNPAAFVYLSVWDDQVRLYFHPFDKHGPVANGPDAAAVMGAGFTFLNDLEGRDSKLAETLGISPGHPDAPF